jgi:hypothetical protein
MFNRDHAGSGQPLPELIIMVISIVILIICAAVVSFWAYYYSNEDDEQALPLSIPGKGKDTSIEVGDHLSISRPRTNSERRRLFLALSRLECRKITTIPEGDEENESDSTHSSTTPSRGILRHSRNLSDSSIYIYDLTPDSWKNRYRSNTPPPKASISSIEKAFRNMSLHQKLLLLQQQNRRLPQPSVYCNDLTDEEDDDQKVAAQHPDYHPPPPKPFDSPQPRQQSLHYRQHLFEEKEDLESGMDDAFDYYPPDIELPPEEEPYYSYSNHHLRSYETV